MGLPPEADPRPWYLEATPLETLPWLVRLLWTTAFVEATAVLVAGIFPHADFPLHRLWPLLAVSAMSHAGVAMCLGRGRPLPPWGALGGLALEVVLLTGLLELTGGPFNPFSVLYAVHITLAAVTLGRLSAAAIAAIAVAGYGLLFYWHAQELDPGHHRLNDFPTHLLTMWIAIATTAELVAYFVVQASNALTRREQELEAMRERAARSERLVSLTTLAAGAAHELSTPLATIALASRELERAAQAHATSAAQPLVDDARLIRAEVDRCQTILDQMSGRAGGSAADMPERVDVHAAITELSVRLSNDRVSRLHVDVPVTLPPIHVPRAGFAQVVLSLLNNAFDASAGGEVVRCAADVDEAAGLLRLAIHDRGAPMDAEVLRRAGEPFYTTKEPGRGLGLGLFLARVFAERCGGSLTLESNDGTTATLALPLNRLAAIGSRPSARGFPAPSAESP